MLNILKRLWIFLILFIFFASAKFLLPEYLSDYHVNSLTTTIKYLYFLIEIGFWISSAAFLSQLVKIFFWESVATRSLQGSIPQLLVELSTVFVFVIAIAIIIGHVFEQPLTGFWATSSVMALIIGLALRNVIFDLFTGVAVNIEKSYKIGDWIQVHQRMPVQNIIGKVTDINWRTTRIRTEENTEVIISNSILSTFVVTNFWNTGYPTQLNVKFNVDFSVPVERVRRIAQAAAKEAILSKGFLSTPHPEVLIGEINDFGVSYKVGYWISFWRDISPSKSKNIMLTAILNHLRRAGITPAYPKQDVYYEKMPTRQLDSALVRDRKELLRQVELFESLNEAELEDLAEAMHQIFYKEGEIIITADTEGSSMFVLLEGLCDVHIDNSEIGQHVKVAQLNPGQFFGEMSLLTGETRSATVTSFTDSLVYEIRKEHLAGLFDKRPEIIMMIGQTLADRRIHNQKLTQNLSDKDLLVQSEKTRQQLVSKIKSFFRTTKQ